MKGNKAVFAVCFMVVLSSFKSATAYAFDRTSLDALLAQKQCPRCDLQYARLSDSNLSGAYLPGANLSAANLSGSDLSGANLSGANLSSANLSEASLSDVNLSGANPANADISAVNLSGAYLSGATWVDGITRCTDDSIGECLSWAGKIGQ